MASLEPFELPADHLAAARRPRRIVVNHQVDGLLKAVNAGMSIPEIMEYEFAFADEAGTHIDSQWWSLDNVFPMQGHRLIDVTAPSVPGYLTEEKVKTFQQWADEGINIARVYIEETKKRGLECFYTYRMNESLLKNDEETDVNPEWIMPGEWDQPLLNFAFPEVRDRKVAYFRELAEDFDFDGAEVDFARGTLVTPAGQQWELRHHATDFLYRVRAATLEAAEARGRPFLIAARVCDNLSGCHFDGLDLRTWIDANLVDFIILGVRSLELEIEQVLHLIGDKPIQVMATLDDHHCSDGYSWPPIEVWRGLAADWWRQGISALQTFNWGVAPPALAERFGLKFRGAYDEGGRQIPVYRQAYQELGDPEKLRFMDKQFVVQRRGGGGSGGADIHEWTTPRFTYQNTNMLAQLPATIERSEVDTLVRIRVADDLAQAGDRISKLELRLLISDPASEKRESGTVKSVGINPFWDIPQLFTKPPAIELADQLQVRVNNIPSGPCAAEDGWFVFRPEPAAFGVGENLIGVCAAPSSASPLTLEKLEVHVSYAT